MNPVLVIDIGNTSASLAVADHHTLSSVQRTPSAEPAFRLRSIPKRAVLASVKPDVNASWETFLRGCGVSDILWVHHGLNLGIPVSYTKPQTIGADRLANACEAAAVYGTPAVVCDFGTALTFDIIRKKEGYVGGIICPGLPLMFDYLAEKTALLPRIRPSKTGQVVGRSTEEAMQIGARLGYLGMVKEILARLKKELGRSTKICATGGFASWVLGEENPSVLMDPHLTLKGLARIHLLNPSGCGSCSLR